MKKNQQLSWNDYLFEKRNKAYGAYDLRTGEGMNLLKSLFIGISFIGLLVALFSFTAKDLPPPAEPTVLNPTFILDPDIEEPPRTKPVLPEAQKPVTPVKTNKPLDSNITPNPIEQPLVETPLNTQEDIGKVEGDEDGNDGDPSTQSSTAGNSNGTGENEENSSNGNEIPEDEEDKIFSPREVEFMPVFPGCENAGSTKKAQQDCLSSKLQNELGIQLSDFAEIASKYNIAKASTRLNFIVDKSGKIIDIRALNNENKEFSKEAQEALKRISDRLIKRGKYLKPAELSDGTKVNVNFSIPVQYIVP